MMGLVVADLVAKLGLDDSAFNRGLDGQMSTFSRRTGAAGAAMTKGLTLPIAAAGAVSIKMAADFQESMTLIQTQAGASAKDVKFLSDAVLNMKDVQHGPKDLANALYHLKSVGMDNKSAMDALTASEHLASVGGSDLETTTNAIASAFKTGISGAQDFNLAAATINATIGAGNLRLEDYVSAMGTGVLVSAKQAGISLTDVGAAIATMTSRGIPATRAATSLKMAFSAMEAPTDKMSKVLGDIGLKQMDLANAMRSGGLPAAVQLLKDHLQGLSETAQTADLTKMFGAKSSQAILTLIANTEDYAKVQKQIVDNSTSGAFQKAIEAQGKDAAAKWKAALADLSKAAVRIGDVLLPAAANIAKAIGTIAGAFDKLGPAGTTAAVAFAGVLAAAGPVLTVMSKLSMLKMAKTMRGLSGLGDVLGAGGGGVLGGGGVGTGKVPARVFSVGASGAASTTIGAGERTVATSLLPGVAGGATATTFKTATASFAGSAIKLAGVVGAFVIAAEVIGKLYGDRALKPGAVVPPGERGGAGVYKWSGGPKPPAPTKDAIAAAAAIDNVMSKLGAKAATATGPAFTRIREGMTQIQSLLDKGFKFGNIKAPHTDSQLRSIRDHIMSALHVTQKQADTIMATMFKDWRPQNQLIPKINRAAVAVESRIAILRRRAGKDIHMGNLDATQMINEIGRVSAALGGVRGAARTAGDAVANALAAKSGVGPSSYRGHFMASGGYVPARPGGTPVVLGEGGEGEYVTPASKMGGGGTVLNIHVANVHGTDRAAATKLANMAGEIFMQQVRFA